jgi:hypothetical protein
MKIDLLKSHQHGGHDGVPRLGLGLYLGLGLGLCGSSIATPTMITIGSLSQPMSSLVYGPLVMMHATSYIFEFGV